MSYTAGDELAVTVNTVTHEVEVQTVTADGLLLVETMDSGATFTVGQGAVDGRVSE